MNREKAIHSGILLFQPQGKIVLKKSWQSKYCMLFNSSKFGIERLEIYDSVDAYNKNNVLPRIFTLEKCIKIMPKDNNVFTIITKSSSQSFGTQSREELKQWVEALQSVAFKDNVSRTVSVMEDNDLYCSSADGTFTVKLFPTELSKKCNLEDKEYSLSMSATSLLLTDLDTDKVLYTWPYPFIRRYGYKQGKLTFEAGTKCKSGEGMFQFEYPRKDIFLFLASKIKLMKKILNGEQIMDDSHLMAFSMEARSRSPLAAFSQSSMLSSFDGKTRPFHLDLNGSRCSSTKPSPDGDFAAKKYSPTDLIDFPSSASSSNPFTSAKSSLFDYEPIDNLPKPLAPLIPDYDKIVERQDAWKTLGLDEVKHSENVAALNDSFVTCSMSSDATDVNPSPKVISVRADNNNYDKLTFFTSVTKVNNLVNNSSNEYKKIDGAKKEESERTSRFDRFIDMSLAGYGRIMQKASRDASVDASVQHQVVNESPYAIISKPKRV